MVNAVIAGLAVAVFLGLIVYMARDTYRRLHKRP